MTHRVPVWEDAYVSRRSHDKRALGGRVPLMGRGKPSSRSLLHDHGGGSDDEFAGVPRMAAMRRTCWRNVDVNARQCGLLTSRSARAPTGMISYLGRVAGERCLPRFCSGQ